MQWYSRWWELSCSNTAPLRLENSTNLEYAFLQSSAMCPAVRTLRRTRAGTTRCGTEQEDFEIFCWSSWYLISTTHHARGWGWGWGGDLFHNSSERIFVACDDWSLHRFFISICECWPSLSCEVSMYPSQCLLRLIDSVLRPGLHGAHCSKPSLVSLARGLHLSVLFLLIQISS